MRTIRALLLFTVIALGLSGCLKNEDANNNPYTKTAPVYTMEFITPGGSGTTTNAGLQFFGAGALTYPGSDVSDTAVFTVRFTGDPVSQDVPVTIGADKTVLQANFANDSIPYEAMPDSVYKFLNTTATIAKGTNTATFQVVFYPSKINPTKNYMLAPTVLNNDHQVSANLGHIFFHTIGNPLAGAYTWEYTRIPSNDSTHAPDTHKITPTTLAPVSPTVVTATTGYYTAPNYLISFTNTNGVLSNFKAVISPDGLTSFANGGISFVVNPIITVSPDYKIIHIKYLVFNGSAYRWVFDYFTKN